MSAGFSPVTWVLARQAGAAAAADAISGLSDGMTFKGTVPTPADLPSTHNDGDMWVITDMDPSAPGNQGAKAVWYNSQWNYFDQQASKLSDLANDTEYISSKITNGAYVDNIHVDGSGTPTSGEYVITDLQFKRNVAASYVPKAGEPVFEKNGSTYRLKIGDGTTTYANLPYIGADFAPSVDGKSVNLVGSSLQIYGFNTATSGAVPRKVGSTLEWVRLSDVVKVESGVATNVTTSLVNNVSTSKVDVLYDNATVKVNAQNKIYIPLDNETIKIKSNVLTAKKTVAGTGVKVETNTDNEYVVSSTFKAGNNVEFETKSDGIYINSTASGSGGVGTIKAGDGIKVTPAGSTVTISADYQAGDYININKNAAGKLEISVDPTAVSNTYRPIELNGVEVLGEAATTGHLNFESLDSTPTGIAMVGTPETGGESIRMEVANRGIVQVVDVGTPHNALATLAGRMICFHCGNSDLSNSILH